MPLHRPALLLLLWTGCSLLWTGCSRPEPGPILTLRSAGYEWALFNHRLSHLEFGVDTKTAWAAVVGGTSTTLIDAELPPSCDPDQCEELPFVDEARVQVAWSRVARPDAASAVAHVALTADADGEEALAVVEIRGAEDLPLSATIRAFRLSTDHPLDGEAACYDPAFGWMPVRLSLSLDDPVARGDEVRVPVQAVFGAGNSLEAIRQCIDQVADRARVAVELDVLVIAGGGAVATADLDGAAAWELGAGAPADPDPQEPPPPQDLALGLQDPVIGWQRMDWSFHLDDPDGRGAYLRSLALEIEDGTGRGTATNYSKGTQLSGFDYRFAGTVVGHEVGGRVVQGALQTTIPVEVDPASGEVGVFELGSTR